MIKDDPKPEKLKSLLREAVLEILKTWAADGKVVNLAVEGLLAITIEKEVFLLSMKEQVSTEVCSASGTFADARFHSELNDGPSDDIMNNLSYAFGPFLTRDDCDKGRDDCGFEDMLTSEEKLKSQTELEEDNLLKGTLDYSSLSLPDVSSERFPFDDNPSNLYVDLDDIINRQNKSSNNNQSLVQNILLGDDLGFKNLERSSSSSDNVNFTNDLLVVGWGDQTTTDDGQHLGEVGPLNLSGPQDLSLSLDKRKFICAICGSLYTSELGHVCKSTHLNTAVVTGEPLNLKSQPLDLTTGPIYLAMDGSIAQQHVLNGGQRVTYDLLTKHTLNSTKDKSEAFKRCEMCGKYLFSNSGYLKHKKQHAGKFRYVCEFCHKGFFDQTNLKTHIDSAHSKLKRYECTRCSKSFFWKHHLKRHNENCKGFSLAPSSTTAPEVGNLFLGSSGHSLPVISNFLLSLNNRQLSTETVSVVSQIPMLKTTDIQSCVQVSHAGPASLDGLLNKSSSTSQVGGVCLLAGSNDYSKYLRNLSKVTPAVTTGNSVNHPLNFLSLQPNTIFQLQQNGVQQVLKPFTVDRTIPIVMDSMSGCGGVSLSSPVTSSPFVVNIYSSASLSSSVLSQSVSSSSSSEAIHQRMI